MSARLVSIVLPFRNEAATLEACLASIHSQTMPEFEVLAIDDGSDDASPEIVARWSSADPRFRLMCPGRPGLAGALNLGLADSRAKYVARMDADDSMHPERLRLQCEFLDAHADVALVGSQVSLFPESRIQAGYREYVRWQNECVTPRELADNIYVESPLAHPSVMFRREVVTALGGYREGDFPEDYELWLRMNEAGCRMAKVPQVLLDWHERDDRASRVDPRYSRGAFDRLRAEYLSRDRRITSGRPVVIWGAGRRTRPRAQVLLERGVKHVAWIDINPRQIGKEIAGVVVADPEWLREREPKPFVLVYVTEHGVRDIVAERLGALGYERGVDWLAVG